MNPLGKLIRSRMDEQGWTYKEVVKNSGDSISLAGVHALVTKEHHRQPPRPSTLESLAKGLRLPLHQVQLAAAEAAGYRLTELAAPADSRLRAVIAGAEELTPEQRDELVTLVQEKIKELQSEVRRSAQLGC